MPSRRYCTIHLSESHTKPTAHYRKRVLLAEVAGNRPMGVYSVFSLSRAFSIAPSLMLEKGPEPRIHWIRSLWWAQPHPLSQ